MNLIRVIPISGSKLLEELSYFTSADAPVGSVVSVPVRSKNIHAVVVATSPAEEAKIDIKNSPFQIRKLNKVKAEIFFPRQFMESCELLAQYYASTTGAIIKTLTSESVLSHIGSIAPAMPLQASFISGSPSPSDTYAVQGDDGDRMSTWRSIIRQEFAKKKSAVIYVPTTEDVKQIFASLQKGIEGYIFQLHGSLNEKKIIETWTAIHETEHPVIIIATGSFALLPRGDIESVIIERENGRGWITQKNPYIDIRHALEFIARRQGQTVYRADSMLRTETLYRLDNHEISEGSPFKWRSISDAQDTIVDMRNKDAKPISPDQDKEEEVVERKGFHVLSLELEELIQRNSDENTHLFILTGRRGLAPTTVCDDCEQIVACQKCNSPVVLHTHKETGRNFFMCHKCGSRRSANETCKNCGSWRLTPLGIGIERVADEIKNKFPKPDIIRIDSDSTKTDKQIADAMERFRSKPGSILLGTEMALPYISEKIEYTAVASLDSLFALPDYRIEEKIMYTLVRLRALTVRTILLQTRRPDEKVFEFALKGNLSDSYKNTLSERKRFAYPPFFLLLKIGITGNKDKIANEMARIQELLSPHEISIFPAFTTAERGNSTIHGLVKIEPHSWPDETIIAKIKSLPPSIQIKINPESIL